MSPPAPSACHTAFLVHIAFLVAVLCAALGLVTTAPTHAQPASTDTTQSAKTRSAAGDAGAAATKSAQTFTKSSVPDTVNVVQRPPNLDSLARQTSFAIAAENFDVVARNLEILTDYRPNDGQLFLLLSRAYSQLNKYDQAVKAQETAIRLGRTSVDTRFRLAVLLNLAERRDESLTVLRSLLQTHADRPEIRMLYAETLILDGQRENGTNEVETLLQMYPDDLSVRMSAVEAMWKAGQNDRAFDITRSNVDDFSDEPLVYGQLADLHLRTEQWNEAEQALNQMESRIQRQKGWAHAIYKANLGYLYARDGRAAEGLDMIQESLEINENNPFALRNLGVAYLNLGETRRACDAFQTAVDRNYSSAFHPSMQFGRHPDDLIRRHCPTSRESATGRTSSDERSDAGSDAGSYEGSDAEE